MKYDYKEAMKQDIKQALEDNGYKLNEENYEDIYESLWIDDAVTGNGSGSYTFSRAKAEEYVRENIKLCIDALEDFGVSAKEFGERVYNEDWEYLDVTIRCYLLGEILTEAMEEQAE